MSDVQELRGKVAVVTGAAGGLGRAMAETFAAEGMTVVLADVEAETLDATVDELRARHDVTGIVTDVGDPDSVEALAAGAFETHGAVHLLCNNAGVGPPAEPHLWDQTPNDWRWTFTVNVFGVAHGISAFVPRMLDQGEPGHVVNTSSPDGGIAAMPRAAVYASSKAAVVTITECLRAQLDELGAEVGASVLLPAGGLMRTGLWTADRNRPAELARERPRSRPGMTAEEFEAMMRERGVDVPVADLHEISRGVLDGVREDRFWIYPEGAFDETVRARAEAIIERSSPSLHEGGI